MNVKKLSISLLKNVGSIVLTLTLVLIVMAWWGNSTPEKSTQAPEFTTVSVSGKILKLSDFKGKIVVLNFWATWCPPCRLEIPSFERIAEGNDDVVFIGVSLDEPGVLDDWLKSHTITYQLTYNDPSLVQPYNSLHSIEKIPTTFLIDKEGNISKIQEGFYSEFQLRWDIFRLGG